MRMESVRTMFLERMSDAELGYMAECYEKEQAIDRFINLLTANPTTNIGEQHRLGHEAGIDLNDLDDAEIEYIERRISCAPYLR